MNVKLEQDCLLDRGDSVRGLRAALDGDRILEAMRRSGMMAVDCRVDRVHPGSRHGVVVDYAMRLRDPAGTERTTRMFGQLPAAELRLAHAAALRRLGRQGIGGNGTGASPISCLADVGVLLWPYETDDRLDGLSAVTRQVEQAPTLLTHRFNKRAVMRTEHAPSGREAILKIYRRKSLDYVASARVQATLAREFSSRAGRIAVPHVLEIDRNLSGIWMESVPGLPIGALPPRERENGIALAGAALARLHGTERLDGLAPYGPIDEIKLLSSWTRFAEAARTNLDHRLSDKLAALQSDFDCSDDFEPCPIHRDYHERQILYRDHSAWLIDFDTIRIGDPAQDLGNFIAHLKLTEHLTGESPNGLSQVFLASYRREPGAREVSPRNLSLHVRATLMRLALIHSFSDTTRWVTGRLLEGHDT